MSSPRTYLTSKSAKKIRDVQPNQLLKSDNSSSRSPEKPKPPATGGRQSLELQFKRHLALAGDQSKTAVKVTAVTLRPRASQSTQQASLASTSDTGSTSLSTNAGSGSSSEHVEKSNQVVRRTATCSARPANVPLLPTSQTHGVIDPPEANKPVRLHRLIDYVQVRLGRKSARLLVALLRKTLAIDDQHQKEYAVSLNTLFSKLSADERAALKEFSDRLDRRRSPSTSLKDWMQLGRALVTCAETVRQHPVPDLDRGGSEDSVDPYRYLLFTPGFSVLFNAMRAKHTVRSDY